LVQQDRDQEAKAAAQPAEGEKLEWEAPELLVEEIGTATQGGTTGDVNPVDDTWYS
jgi:hypothetical protein